MKFEDTKLKDIPWPDQKWKAKEDVIISGMYMHYKEKKLWVSYFDSKEKKHHLDLQKFMKEYKKVGKRGRPPKEKIEDLL